MNSVYISTVRNTASKIVVELLSFLKIVFHKSDPKKILVTYLEFYSLITLNLFLSCIAMNFPFIGRDKFSNFGYFI